MRWDEESPFVFIQDEIAFFYLCIQTTYKKVGFILLLILIHENDDGDDEEDDHEI